MSIFVTVRRCTWCAMGKNDRNREDESNFIYGMIKASLCMVLLADAPEANVQVTKNFIRAAFYGRHALVTIRLCAWGFTPFQLAAPSHTIGHGHNICRNS